MCNLQKKILLRELLDFCVLDALSEVKQKSNMTRDVQLQYDVEQTNRMIKELRGNFSSTLSRYRVTFYSSVTFQFENFMLIKQ